MKEHTAPRIIFHIFLITLLTIAGLFACGRGEPAKPAEPAGIETPAANPATGPSPDKIAVELFVMSQCPFGKGAEGVMHKISDALPGKVALSLGFILDEKEGPDKFRSLHGAAEVDLDRVQACVGIVQPDKQLEFIYKANETPDPWQKTASGMGLDVGNIEKCTTDGRGDEVLRKDAQITKKRGITASPTLFVNGKEYSGTISSLDVFEKICSEFGAKAPDACKKPPETLSRSDGASAGHCGDTGNEPPIDPSMVDNTVFTLTAIYPAKAFTDTLDPIINQTKRLFPKANIEKIASTDPKAKKLIEQDKLEWLPAFLFPKSIESAKNFVRLRGVLIPVGQGPEGYQIDPQQIGANVSLARKATPGTINIFYTPYSMKSITILLDILDLLQTPEYAKYKDKITYTPAARIDRKGQLAAQFGPPEVEEMQRQTAILSLGDLAKFRAYLEARRDNPMGTYWEEFVKKAGLSPEEIKAKATAKETGEKLIASSKEATDLGIQQDNAFLVNNTEVAQVKDKDDFRKLLAYAEGKSK